MEKPKLTTSHAVQVWWMQNTRIAGILFALFMILVWVSNPDANAMMMIAMIGTAVAMTVGSHIAIGRIWKSYEEQP